MSSGKTLLHVDNALVGGACPEKGGIFEIFFKSSINEDITACDKFAAHKPGCVWMRGRSHQLLPGKASPHPYSFIELIFWLNTAGSNKITETFDEIVAAYKAGKNIWIRDTDSFGLMVAIAPAFLVAPSYVSGNITDILIVCGGSAYASSDIGAQDSIMNVTYYIYAIPENVVFLSRISMCAEIGDGYTPNESQLNGYPGDSTSASPVDHIHPAPFPDWTSSIGKALFVGNTNTAPRAAFEWRDVPNGDFTSKVGDFLRVAEVDSSNKPTKWTTDSIANAKGVNF